MSRRPVYPTTSRTSGSNRAPRVTSPADSVHRSSVSASSDPMGSKKRSTGPERGNSPPEKRVRSGEYDRYATLGSPMRPFSPPYSEHSSITNIHVPVPTGLAPKTKHGRCIDHYRPTRDEHARRESLDRRVPNGVRMPSDAGQSPLVRNRSPLSGWHGDRGTPGSGDSTPQQVAPPAPSMLATTSSSSVGTSGTRFDLQALASVIHMATAEYNNSQLEQQEKLEDSPSGTVSSLRIIKARKRAQASAELEYCKQRMGNFMPQIVPAATADKNGTESLSNEERATSSRTQAEYKALQIEVENLKNERKTILSRLEELEKLSGLPKSFDQLRATSNKLDQWRQNQPEPLTLEQVQTTIKEYMPPALDAIKTDFTTQIKQALKESSPSPASVQDVRMLVEFKKQIEEANWPNQLHVLKERIEEVSKHRGTTHSNVEKLTIELEKLGNTQNNALKGLEQKFDEKIAQNLDDFKSDLKRVNGPLKDEHARTGKTVLDRVQLLETSYSQIEASQGNHDMLSEDLANAKRDINARLANLSATATDAKTIKELDDRIDTVITTIEELRETTNTRLTSLSATATDVKRTEELDGRIDVLNTMVKELCDTTVASEDKRAAKTSSLEGRINKAEGQIYWIDKASTISDQTRLELDREIKTAQVNIGALHTGLNRVEESVHNFTTFIKTLKEDSAQRFRVVQDTIQTLKDRLETQLQVATPQSTLTAAERQQLQQIQSLVATSQTLTKSNSALQRWRTDMDTRADWSAQFTEGLSQRITVIERAVHSLEDRYDSLSTDTLHQQMVHWFTQNYPSARDILDKLGLIQQELLGLKGFAKGSSWLFQCKDPLLQLAQVAQQLADMARNSTSLQELPQIKEKLERTFDIAESAMRTSNAVTNVANSNTSSIAKLNSTLTALKGDTILLSEYRARQTELSNDINQQRESVHALRAKIDSACKEGAEAINKLTAHIGTVDSSLSGQGERIDSLDQQLDANKGSVSSLEKALNEDKTLLFIAMIPKIIMALTQYQRALEDINANLPGGGLAFKFLLDLEELEKMFTGGASVSEG